MPRRAPYRLPPALELLVAAVLGAIHSLPFIHTEAWPLQLAVVGVLVWRASSVTPRSAAVLGLVFGTAWLGAGTWWLYISLHDYGGLAGWLAVLAIGLLSALLSLYLAAALAAFARWQVGVPGADALLFGGAWLLAELARGVIFTGFPWVASGYAHVDSPLAALAPLVGVYGIGFVGAASIAWVVLGWKGTGWVRLVPIGTTAGVLVMAAVLGPARVSTPSGSLGVTLLQGNVAQDEKFAQERMPQALAWTRAQLLAANGALVIGPETVIPLLPDQLDPDYWQAITEHFRRPGKAALIGLPLGDPAVGYTNSAAGISADTAALPGGFYRYDKHHLVPFGEFIPFGFRWFTELMNIPLGDFNRGPVGPPSFAFHGQRIGANICYEDLFGEELAARFEVPAEAPTMFANISNIAWFGDTIAITQHLQISRMRTLEFQRPMLRATNTGATVVIDHTGRVTASLPAVTQGVLDATVEGRTGLTPFAWWAARFGLWPLWALGAVIVVGGAIRAERLRAQARRDGCDVSTVGPS